LISLVDESYRAADRDRYTLERSLDISSEELQAQYALQKSSYESQLNAIFTTLQDLIWLVDVDSVYVACNERYARFHGRNTSEIIGKFVKDLFEGPVADSYVDKNIEILQHGKSTIDNEWMTPASNHEAQLYEVIRTPMLNDAGRVVGVLGVARNITQRYYSDQKLQLSASVFSNVFEGILITGPDNVIIDVNPAFLKLTGYSRKEIIGLKPEAISARRHDSDFFKTMWTSLRENDYWQGEMWAMKKTGEEFPVMLSVSVVRDNNSSVKNYIGVFSDITEIKQYALDLDRLAYFDPLTNLPNRRLFTDRMEQAIVLSNRNKTNLAVGYLDLDGFKPINDRYGHKYGDECLIEISRRIRDSLRETDTLSRFGGDEFVLLISNFNTTKDCELVLKRILDAISQPILINNVLILLSASLGVALCPPDHADIDTLIRHADQAMYRAKENGKNQYQFFDPERDKTAKTSQLKMAALEKGLEDKEFIFHYQPKVNINTGEIIGFEALIRWQHPNEGLLSPAKFYPYVIGTDLDLKIGDYAIESALNQLSLWNDIGRNFSISVNVSASHLLKQDFFENLMELLSKYPAVNAGQLELEILESAAISDMQVATKILDRCRSAGFKISLDDFGTGYSSLAYFRRLPVDNLKIDQSFVIDMLLDTNDFDIVEAIIKLSMTFGRPVIAEGVETLEHCIVLKALGCNLSQGYGISRPMPGDQVLKWADNWLSQGAWIQIADSRVGPESLPFMLVELSHRVWLNRLRSDLESPEGREFMKMNLKQSPFLKLDRSVEIHGPVFRNMIDSVAPLYHQIHDLEDKFYAKLDCNELDIAGDILKEMECLNGHFIEKLNKIHDEIHNEGIHYVA